MHKILLASWFSKLIEDWNERLDSFATEYMDNVWVGAALVIIIFVFGCWAISYFTKK